MHAIPDNIKKEYKINKKVPINDVKPKKSIRLSIASGNWMTTTIMPSRILPFKYHLLECSASSICIPLRVKIPSTMSGKLSCKSICLTFSGIYLHRSQYRFDILFDITNLHYYKISSDCNAEVEKHNDVHKINNVYSKEFFCKSFVGKVAERNYT